jgi:hypothetical protein|tara:strand:+ start:926 stop:1138 length:213 start_codon:yes stop_codon:yes gene_type:complete
MTVFVLTITSWDVENPGITTETEIVGVYRSLEAVKADQAARYSGCVERYGTIHLDWEWQTEEVPSPWNKE